MCVCSDKLCNIFCAGVGMSWRGAGFVSGQFFYTVVCVRSTAQDLMSKICMQAPLARSCMFVFECCISRSDAKYGGNRINCSERINRDMNLSINYHSISDAKIDTGMDNEHTKNSVPQLRTVCPFTPLLYYSSFYHHRVLSLSSLPSLDFSN